jgi:Glycosyl hydrolase family 65, C-terminal domain
MIQGWRLRVEITRAEARYALADGGPLEIAHHGQPVSLTAGKPQTRPILAAPSRPPPSQPPAREPTHRPPTANPGHRALTLTRPRTPAISQRQPRRTVRLTQHRAR